MRENKYYGGTGWVAAELSGKDRYASQGQHSWEDTVEVRVKSTTSLSDFIQSMNIKKYLVMQQVLTGFYEYLFAYVPVGTAEDFCGSLNNEMKRINQARGLTIQNAVPEKKGFDEMYLDFEKKYNPYPVQMSRADAFSHAYRDGIIDSTILHAAREYYGSLWNYVGD